MSLHMAKLSAVVGETRVGHGSGPCMGWIGLGWVGSGRFGSSWVTKFSVLGGSGWVGSSVKNI